MFRLIALFLAVGASVALALWLASLVSRCITTGILLLIPWLLCIQLQLVRTASRLPSWWLAWRIRRCLLGHAAGVGTGPRRLILILLPSLPTLVVPLVPACRPDLSLFRLLHR